MCSYIMKKDVVYSTPNEKNISCIDYKSDAPGKGAGFRSDGSHTLGYNRMIGNTKANYYIDVINSMKDINKEYFIYLERIAKILQMRGGNLILLFPPMSTNIENEILISEVGEKVKEYKKFVSNWSIRKKVKLVDAGNAVKYGCNNTEFYDAHHALDLCYEKIWAREF